jgi:hypothetical protein
MAEEIAGERAGQSSHIPMREVLGSAGKTYD